MPWLFLLVIGTALFLAYAPWGFNPTDDGWVLDTSWRLLGGARPHVDLVSNRPLGAAIVHTLDFLLPMPILLASRLVVAMEVVAYSALFARLLYRRSLNQWGIAHHAGVVAAVVLNLHVFPLLVSGTIDGLVALGAALVLLDTGGDRPAWWRVSAAGGLLGAALLMKPSFALGPVLAVLLLARPARQAGHHWSIAALLVGVGSYLVPLATYVAWTALGGGLGLLVTQLGHVVRVSAFYPLRAVAAAPGDRIAWALDIVAAACGFVLVGITSDALGPRLARLRPKIVVAGGAVVVAAVGATVVGDFLRGEPALWADRLLAMLLVSQVLRLRQGRLQAQEVAVMVSAYSAGLSGGYATPALMAGAIALALVIPVAEELGSVLPRARRSGAAIAVVVAFALVLFGWNVRMSSGYFELPRPSLTVDLGTVVPRLSGTRTNPLTARFMSDVVACHSRFPSRRLAVMPDTAIAPMALNVRPALPISWATPVETNGSEDYLLAAARRLNEGGDYLVLFETFNPQTIAFRESLPVAGPGVAFFGGVSGISSQVAGADSGSEVPTGFPLRLAAVLSGERHYCGSFIAVYRR